MKSNEKNWEGLGKIKRIGKRGQCNLTPADEAGEF
jgi:hypothetical protein